MIIFDKNEPVPEMDPETFKQKLYEAAEIIYNDSKKCKPPDPDEILKYLEERGIDLSAEYAQEYLRELGVKQ